jgi:hypothetical protein
VVCHFDHLVCQQLLVLLHECCLHAGNSPVTLQHRHFYMQPVCADFAARGPAVSAGYVPAAEVVSAVAGVITILADFAFNIRVQECAASLCSLRAVLMFVQCVFVQQQGKLRLLVKPLGCD